MKSCRVILIALFSFIYISLNAQVFVGGSFGFNTSNSEHNATTTTNKVSNYNLDLSPRVGKFLSEKLAIGLALDISLSGNKTDVNFETISKSSGIGISLLLRYYAIRWNKVSVFGQGNIGLAFSNSSVKMGGVTTDGPKGTRVYLSIYPGLSYDISEKLSLETSLNILSFGYNYFITKDGSSKDNNSSFNIGAGLANIVSLNAITIGAIYKF
jgi:outer membrane protein